MAMRAVARGWKVCVVQFLKSGPLAHQEEAVGRRLGIDWNPLGDGFTWDSDDLEATRERARPPGRRPGGCCPPATTNWWSLTRSPTR